MSIGSIFSSIANPSSLAMLAMGPTGWAALAAKTLMSSFGQQFIQQFGQQLGLPQPMIDMAQASFAGSMGDFQNVYANLDEAIAGVGAQFGSSPAEIGAAQSQGRDAIDNLISSMNDRVREESDEIGGGSTSGKGSLLMKIAVALGKLLDQKMTDMADRTDEIGQLGTIDEGNQSKLGQLTGELQGLGQEVNMLSNALSNTIKSIGEANTTLARKG
ncbi:hypothetical protein [Novosphingobium sp.]|jgi:hypothetical protein|uniref:hypothetical protein n=1 Tax=Novosphingobium sp. TaxID=1874826 RepID=UPI002FDF4E0E